MDSSLRHPERYDLLSLKRVIVTLLVPAAAVTPSVVRPVGRLTREVNSELTAVYALLLQNVLGTKGALDVDEVGVCETPRLTRTTVNGDSDVKNVLDRSEQVCRN